jgi:hypothetical protein
VGEREEGGNRTEGGPPQTLRAEVPAGAAGEGRGDSQVGAGAGRQVEEDSEGDQDASVVMRIISHA